MNSWPALRRRTDDKGLVQAPSLLTTTPGSLLGAVWGVNYCSRFHTMYPGSTPGLSPCSHLA